VATGGSTGEREREREGREGGAERERETLKRWARKKMAA